ncbi:MAG: hypothetical protein N3A69_17615 [Leptospiraceae bacterium]|nr:hypothetical protein [Leptospiraceae bacterium]
MEEILQTKEELYKKLEEIRELKSEIKSKLSQLETNLNSLNEKVKNTLNFEAPDSQRFFFKYARLAEIQVNSLEKMNNIVRHYYELLKDLTEKEVKILLELDKLNKLESQETSVSQEQLWLAISKINLNEKEE